MCFAIPSKVLEVDPQHLRAKVDTMGRIREVSIHLFPEGVQVGEYILIQSGFAMEKIDEAAALDSLELYREIFEKMEQGAT